MLANVRYAIPLIIPLMITAGSSLVLADDKDDLVRIIQDSGLPCGPDIAIASSDANAASVSCDDGERMYFLVKNLDGGWTVAAPKRPRDAILEQQMKTK